MLPSIASGNVASATASTGYEVANSVRMNRGDSPSFTRSVGSNGDFNTATLSMWVKKCSNGIDTNRLWLEYENGTNYEEVRFRDDDTLRIYSESGGGTYFEIITNRKFRDVSAFYHICVIYDYSQSTSTDRIKLFINGTRETSFSTYSVPSQGGNSSINKSGNTIYIGGYPSGSNYFDGYFSECVWLDGTAAAVTDFGEFDEDSPTIWKPKDVSELTAGTNGWYMDFEDSSNLGNDVFGGTDFTENNLAATDQCTDTPTNNFCTLNPLDQTNTGGSSATMVEGNLKWTSAGNNTSQSYMRSTFGLTAGKWYWEAKMSNANSGTGFNLGVSGADADMNAGSSGNMQDSDPNTMYNNGGTRTKKDGVDVTTGLTAIAENDIIQVALDLDNQKIYFGANGTWMNSANPATGSNPPATVDANTTYLPAHSDSGYADQITIEFNFGNPTFSISSGNADGNGYGNFEYSVPSGYLALCTKNLGSDGG